jgi:hypothetical protein
MKVYLSSFGGVGWQFFSDNGVPLSGGKIYTFQAGTTTPAPTYTSSSGAIAQPNPIILNSAGRVPSNEIWQPAGSVYKYALYTSTDTLIGIFDNIPTIAAGEGNVENFTGNGTQINFILSSIPISENSTNVYINGVYQQKNTFSLSSNKLIFSTAPPYTSTIEVVYF